MAEIKTFGLHKLFSPRYQILKKANKLANIVDSQKERFRKMSNDELSKKTEFFLQELASGKSLDDILVEVIATAREAIFRIHKIYAYKVQIIGALIVHFGDFAEMYTGEGKTLTIILVAYLNALAKKGVHIVTVNEYLVKRDAMFCAQALNPLGITVGYNTAEMDSGTKQKMYACDITYTTNSELGFDYLRDNMVKRMEEKVIRDLSFAIIDEADSVLIDEARTPLIISGQPKKDVSLYLAVDDFVKILKKEDYKIDHESNTITLVDSGINKAQTFFKVKNLFDIEHSDLFHKIKNALMAHYVFAAGVEYIAREDKILLIDHFTGRILDGRSYNAGLQQAIQAKERVKIEPENVIVATVTYQSFFRLYKKLAGVSGTALTEQEEFLKIYNMVVVPIPTNRKVVRKDLNDYVFNNKKAKWNHVAAEIEKIHATGQPILVGTSSVEDSEELVHILRNHGIKYELLNAKNHAREAEIIAKGGQLGAITIATNMAGRGTDIKINDDIKKLGGLFVIGTDHHESRRVDNQLRGRSGRQGDPGITRFFVSLEDVLFRRFSGDKIDKANTKVDDDSFFDSKFFNRMIITMQKKVEGLSFDTRKNLIDYDIVLSNQRELVYKQRDQILKNKENQMILTRMSHTVAVDLIDIFKDKENPNIVNAYALAEAINNKLLFAQIVKSSAFFGLETRDVQNKLIKIIELSIKNRLEIMNPSYANNIVRDIMIQNLDAQWTLHLDLMTKIREGVMLRSLEQRSPLNIYVEDADKHFNKMKRNVAHNSVISLHRVFVPNANKTLCETLFSNNILTKDEIINYDMMTAGSSPKVDEVLNSIKKQPNITIDMGPKSPKDMPLNDNQIINKAKEILMAKLKEAQAAQKKDDSSKEENIESKKE